MKKLLLLALLVLGVSTFVQAQTQGKVRVAVYVSGDLSNNYKKIICTKAMTHISRSTTYVAVERSEEFLDVLMKEQDYEFSGEVRLDQIATFGKRCGATYVLALDATCIDDVGFLTARLIDTVSGKVKKSVDTNRKVSSIEDWIAMTNNVAFRIIPQK